MTKICLINSINYSKMETRHVKLDYNKALESKKEILTAELNLIHLIKKMKNYRILRKSEKAQNNKLKVLLTSVKTKTIQLESHMPEHEQTLIKKQIKPKQEKPKDELQTELEKIQEKLARLSK